MGGVPRTRRLCYGPPTPLAGPGASLRPGPRRGCRERMRDRNRRVPKVRLRTAALALAGLMAAAGPTPSSAYQPPVFAAPQGDYHAVISMVEVDDYPSALIMRSEEQPSELK